MVGVLPIRTVQFNVSSIGPSSERRRANARNVRFCYPYWQYTDLFIFRFVSLLCLRSTPCLLFFMFPCFPYSYRNTASSQSKLTFSKCYFINVYFHTAYATNNVYCTILIILAVMRPSAKSFVAKLRLESCRHSVNSYISIARFLKKLDNN